MKTIRQPLMLAASLVAALALGGCGKGGEPASPAPTSPPPSATAPPPPMAPAEAPPPATTSAMPAGSSTAAVSFSSLELGSTVDANNKVIASGTSFAPKDTIYASVETMGNGHATLAAKWTYQGEHVVHEDSKTLDSMGPQTTAFMISKPDGFPAGDYKIEVSLNGAQVASRDFSVK